MKNWYFIALLILLIINFQIQIYTCSLPLWSSHRRYDISWGLWTWCNDGQCTTIDNVEKYLQICRIFSMLTLFVVVIEIPLLIIFNTVSGRNLRIIHIFIILATFAGGKHLF